MEVDMDGPEQPNLSEAGVQPELFELEIVIVPDYVKIQKALYGMLKSALLFYCKLQKDLENMGFKVNESL